MNVKTINNTEVKPINSTDMLDNERNIDERIAEKLHLGEMSIGELIQMQAIEESTRSTGERGSDIPTEGAMEEALRIFEGQPIYESPRNKDNDSMGEMALSSTVGQTPGSSKLEPEKVRKLKKGEVKRLQELESIVTDGAKSRVASGCALFEIYSRENGVFWKSKYSSFDLYCHEKWGYKKSQSYRLLKIGKFMADLNESPNGYSEDLMPTNECQVRPILEWLKKHHQVKCWHSIVADVKPAELTGKIVQERVIEYRKVHGLDVKKPRPVIPRIDRVAGAFGKLVAIFSEFPKGDRYYHQLMDILNEIRKDEAEGDAETLPPRKETPITSVKEAAAEMTATGF
jgi:hypothetical protein